MSNQVVVIDWLLGKWLEYDQTRAPGDVTGVSNWYFNCVKELLLLLKHDLQIIASEKVVVSDKFVLQQHYRARGVCAILSIPTNWAYKLNSKNLPSIYDCRIINEVYHRFAYQLKRGWTRTYNLNSVYPINVMGEYSKDKKANSTQFDMFINAVDPECNIFRTAAESAEMWDLVPEYAAARIVLIDQVLAMIDTQNICSRGM